jgi:alpha,alpha-trehalase
MKLQFDIQTTLAQLLQQEDTDGDKRITIEDKGLKRFVIQSEKEDIVIEGTYFLSNLLQELILAQDLGVDFIDTDLVFEHPADRISRMIKDYYWEGLTRTMDEKGLRQIVTDSKSKTSQAIVYVPFTDDFAYNYYQKLASKFNIKVVQLPKEPTPEYVSSINDEGGILSLSLIQNGDEVLGTPFVVPGARFNEMYGWDSYFENIGLLIDGKQDLAQAMVENFGYQIQHYGKILNANRSYYLTRTQPPFYSSMIREVFESSQLDTTWLQHYLEIAIKEYETVWMVEGKRLSKNGLNRYFAEGIGLPPETEPGHYDAVLEPYAKEAQLSIAEYEDLYYKRQIQNPELDAYFVHDRSVRESGHDTSYRLEGKCASLNTVELNAMLYKYETDFSALITTHFEGNFTYNNTIYTADYWDQKARVRKVLIDLFLWNDDHQSYFDYNLETECHEIFLSATSFFPLWAKVASPEQAAQLVENHLPKIVQLGGVSGCSKEALKSFEKHQMQRQWDYPNGWPPHQMIIWQGLINYGYDQLAQELIYRWLWTITNNASDYNGTVPEKYDVVAASHKVFAEYGNQGTDFEYITREGFGWMNASFQLGMQLVSPALKLELNQRTHPLMLFGK